MTKWKVVSPSVSAARAAFLANYDDRFFLGAVTAMPVEEFKRKVLATHAQPAMVRVMALYLRASGPVS